MNKKQPTLLLKLSAVALLASALTACGGGDGDGFIGGDPAVGCVQQNTVSTGVVDITNTCDDTIIVLNSDGRRFVIEPGVTNRVTGVGFGSRFASCFAPSEPEFTSATEFVCN